MSSRQAVRVLLFDEADRVLLVRFSDGDRSWWCTPGGGIEAGDTDDEAARRELREELGSVAIELGPCIWTRRHLGTFHGRPFDQSERIYLTRAAAFEPQPSVEALLEHRHDDIRWLTSDELATREHQFGPRRLPALVHELLRNGPPLAPLDVGV